MEYYVYSLVHKINVCIHVQLAINKKITLFVEDPTKIPGLEQNFDWVEFGYGHYVGAPWSVGQVNGKHGFLYLVVMHDCMYIARSLLHPV